MTEFISQRALMLISVARRQNVIYVTIGTDQIEFEFQQSVCIGCHGIYWYIYGIYWLSMMSSGINSIAILNIPGIDYPCTIFEVKLLKWWKVLCYMIRDHYKMNKLKEINIRN